MKPNRSVPQVILACTLASLTIPLARQHAFDGLFAPSRAGQASFAESALTPGRTPRAARPTPADRGEPIWAGLPEGGREPLTILRHTGFTAGYSLSSFTPCWTAYEVRPQFGRIEPLKPAPFTGDPGLLAETQVAPDAYKRSGYFPCQMAPAAPISMALGPEAGAETWYTSNLAPMRTPMHRSLWSQLSTVEFLEYARRYNGVLVYDGPVYRPHSDAGFGQPHRILIPEAFFKIIVRRRHKNAAALAFIIPQSPLRDDISKYLVSVETIERATGLRFFTALPPEEQTALKGPAATSLW